MIQPPSEFLVAADGRPVPVHAGTVVRFADVGGRLVPVVCPDGVTPLRAAALAVTLVYDGPTHPPPEPA